MSLKGKDIVFSGRLSKSRREMKKEVQSAGATVHTYFSCEVGFIVAGWSQREEQFNQTLIRHARKNDIEIIDEEEYRKRMASHSSPDPSQ